MDSLGMIAQEKDAEAVLASFVGCERREHEPVDGDFYARWVKDPADGKAEALRQAQLALLRGGAAGAQSKTERGFAVADESGQEQGARAEGFSHPFYWAPFVADWEFSVASGAWCAATVIICWSSFEREKSVCNEDG